MAAENHTTVSVDGIMLTIAARSDPRLQSVAVLTKAQAVTIIEALRTAHKIEPQNEKRSAMSTEHLNSHELDIAVDAALGVPQQNSASSFAAPFGSATDATKSTLPKKEWRDLAEDLLAQFPGADRAELLKDVVAHCFFEMKYGNKREERAACDFLNEVQRIAVRDAKPPTSAGIPADPVMGIPITGLRPVLDACCGGRMMWFDKDDKRAIFQDIRRERVKRPEAAAAKGWKDFDVNPDILGSFTAMEFPDNTFSLVVFDPPHLTRCGDESYMAKAYGKLMPDWEDTIRGGFSECFRVLKPNGVLIFKWNESRIKISKVLELAVEKPLFGHKSGKTSMTHWIAFLKPNDQAEARTR